MKKPQESRRATGTKIYSSPRHAIKYAPIYYHFYNGRRDSLVSRETRECFADPAGRRRSGRSLAKNEVTKPFQQVKSHHFNFDINSGGQIQIGKRINSPRRGIHNINHALMHPHLKLLPRVFMHKT